jgi:hypothetical protein
MVATSVKFGFEVWIRRSRCCQFVKEGRILWPAICVKESELVGEMIVGGLEDHATNRCDANASGQKDGGDARVVVKDEFAPGCFQREFGAEWDGVQRSFEGGIAHSRCDHEVFFEGRTGERKAADVALSVGFGRIGEGKVAALASRGGKARWFFEVKSHRSGGNFVAAFQFDPVIRHWVHPFLWWSEGC